MSEENLGKIVIFLGPSGSGKTSTIRAMKLPELLSVTTRDPRPGEVDGVDYDFITLDEFEKMSENNEFAEYVTYHGTHYGYTKKAVEKAREKNDITVCAAEIEGVKQLKFLYGKDVIVIFLWADWSEIYNRLVNKRKDPINVVKDRLSTYQKEMSNFRYANYAINTTGVSIKESAAKAFHILMVELYGDNPYSFEYLEGMDYLVHEINFSS